MAVFTASAAQSTAIAFMSVNGTLDRVVSYTHPTALSAGDVIQMCKVPSGAIVLKTEPVVSVSAGVVTANIGDGNDTSAYAAAVVMSAVQTFAAMPFRGPGRSYSAEDTVDFQITALSAVPGTCKLKLRICYTMQNNN